MKPSLEIFYVLNARWPTIRAYGLQVAKTCEGFKQAGTPVHLVVPRRTEYEQTKGADPLVWYGIRDRFRFTYLPSLDVLHLGFGGKIAFVVQQTLFGLLAACALMFKKGVIYSRDQFTLYLLSFFRRSIFWEVHRFPEDTGALMYRQLMARVSGIVCISEGLRKKFLEQGVSSAKLLVAPDGIDTAEFEISHSQLDAQQELGLDSSKHIVMYTGHLLEWKGVETLVAAAQLLDDRFQIVVVGGTDREVARLKSSGGAGKVHWVPFQPHARIPLWLRAADTVILPNKRDGGISEFYTSPLKMFEYMAAGKCIVASDLPSIREVLNESNAILVHPDDPRALAEGITRSAQEEEASRARAERARQDAERYTWIKRGRAIINFITQ